MMQPLPPDLPAYSAAAPSAAAESPWLSGVAISQRGPGQTDGGAPGPSGPAHAEPGRETRIAGHIVENLMTGLPGFTVHPEGRRDRTAGVVPSLRAEFGKGYDRSNLFHRRAFFLA